MAAENLRETVCKAHNDRKRTALKPHYNGLSKKPVTDIQQVHGTDCHGHGTAFTVLSRHSKFHKDKLHQHPAGHCHVRNGAYAQAKRLPHTVQTPQRRAYRHRGAVPDHAASGLYLGQSVQPVARVGHRSDTGWHLSGRHFVERNDLSGQGRRGAVGRHNVGFHHISPRVDTAAHLYICRRDRGCEHGLHVSLHHTGGGAAHSRRLCGKQVLPPVHRKGG